MRFDPVIVICAGALLLCGVLSGCTRKAAEADAADEAKPAVSVPIETVTKRTIRQLLTVPGSFVPTQGSEAKLTPAVAGRIAKVYVHEGDVVAAGQLLATLDLGVQHAQQNSAAAGLQAARAQAVQSQLDYKASLVDQQTAVKIARIGLDQATLQRDTDVTQAELAYAAARADLQKTRAGARPQEISQAHEGAVQARAARDRAATELQRDEDLWPDGYISKRQLDDAKTALDTSNSALAAAEANESLVRAGARPEEIRSMEAHAAAARNQVESARALDERRVEAAKAALRQAEDGALAVQAKFKESESSQALAVEKRADASAASATTELGSIRAPFEGRISRRMLDQGDAADTTTPVFEIVRTAGKADFASGCLPSLAAEAKPGQKVQIETSSEQAVEGVVVSVASADAQTGLCSIRISCASPPAIGTYGTASVVVETLANQIAVPNTALLNRDGKTMVLRDVDDAAKETEVQTGPEDDKFTAILSGLKVGEKIVASGGNELDDGTKITERKAEAEK